MQQRMARVALALALGACSACRDTGAHNYPADPLLLNRKPIESRPEDAQDASAKLGGAVPSAPPTVLADCPGTPATRPDQLARQ